MLTLYKTDKVPILTHTQHKEEIMEKQLTDNQIEKLILNRLFFDNEYYDIVAKYNESKYYTNKTIPKLNKLVIDYKEQYKDTPGTETMHMLIDKACEIDGQAAKMKNMFDGAIAIDVKEPAFVQDNVLSYIKEKATYWTIIESIDDIQKTKDVSAIIDAFQQIEKVAIDQDNGFDYFEDQTEHWSQIMSPDAMLSTGFVGIDEPTNGGFPSQGECLIVFMAQANTGKSLMLSNLAVNMLQEGKFCIIVSLEMGALIYGKRIDAHISSCDVNKLVEHNVIAKERIVQFKELHEDAQLLIKPFPPNTVNTLSIQTYIERQIQLKGRKPDAIFIDYINLIEPNRAGDSSMYERVGTVSRDLRALSYHFECPVVTATQTNRTGWDTSDVSMANISESAGIAHTADYLAALWQVEGDREAGIIHNTTLKNRFGVVGHTADLRLDYTTLRMSDKPVSHEAIAVADSLTTTLAGLGDL